MVSGVDAQERVHVSLKFTEDCSYVTTDPALSGHWPAVRFEDGYLRSWHKGHFHDGRLFPVTVVHQQGAHSQGADTFDYQTGVHFLAVWSGKSLKPFLCRQTSTPGNILESSDVRHHEIAVIFAMLMYEIRG